MANADQSRSAVLLLDENGPGVRYLTLRDLCDRASNNPQLATARREAHRAGPISTILD